MNQRTFYIILIIIFLLFSILGFIKFITSKNFYRKHITPYETLTTHIKDTLSTELPPVIIPVSDEENINTITVDKDVTEKKEEIAQVIKKEENVKCPSGNTLAGYDELSPVSPDFGLDYYRPDDLIAIPKEIPTPRVICVREKTLVALIHMHNAMLSEGLAPMIVSGFRSSTYQKSIQENNRSQTLPDGTTVRSVALPHHSEHQLGTTIDFAAAPHYNIKDFENSPEYAWMLEHADEYGFIQSYHYGNESLTGYRGEPWHWRYVGSVHAQSVKNTGKILFQYLQDLLENSKIKNPS